MKVADWSGACTELSTLLREPPAKLPRSWEAGPLRTFTQRASQTIPVGDVVAVSQLSHKPQGA